MNSKLWQEAFEHPDHLCQGKCPDEDYMDSRDPKCFYCNVMRACEALDWYQDEAVAIHVHMKAKRDLAVMACVTALSLDGGNRAHQALQ